MTIEDQITDEKLQYYINREAAKISALSSGKMDKYEYLTGEEILPSNQQQIIEQVKFTGSSLGKTLEKQIKTIKDQGEEQIKAIQDKWPIKSIGKFTYDINWRWRNKISDGEINLTEVRDEQAKLSMGEIKRVQKRYLLKESMEARTNIENLYNARKAAIDFFDEYTSRASEARRQAKKGTGIKKLNS